MAALRMLLAGILFCNDVIYSEADQELKHKAMNGTPHGFNKDVFEFFLHKFNALEEKNAILENTVAMQKTELELLSSKLESATMSDSRDGKPKRFVVVPELPIAFTTRLNPYFLDHVNPGDVITFGDILTNHGGGLNTSSSVFTAPMAGIYLISCSLMDSEARGDGSGVMLHADIVKNGNVVLGRVFAHAEGRSYRDQGAQTVIVELQNGDRVWIRNWDSRDLGAGAHCESYINPTILRIENMTTIADMRHPYHGINETFDIKDLKSTNPIKQFSAWFDEVRESNSRDEPNAMALATANKDGRPSVRMVLLKGFDEDGFTFFTNYDSRKGQELAENPYCSLMFYWESFKRSIRIEGKAERIPVSDSESYFNRRPKESRIGAMVSHQSTVITSREVLNKRNEELTVQYKDTDPPKPDYWGGYLVRPDVFEFWQGQSNRLHDRLRFRRLEDGEEFDSECMTRGQEGWIIDRLSS